MLLPLMLLAAHVHIAPVVEADVVTIVQTRTPAAIAARLSDVWDLHACAREPGTLTVTIVIRGDGVPNFVSSTADPEVAACLTKAIARAVFPLTANLPAPVPEQRVVATLRVVDGLPPPRLGKEQIADAVNKNIKAVQQCYERELKRAPGIGGRLTMTWTVGPQGTVIEARTTTAPPQMTGVGECLRQEISSWTFAAPAFGTPVTVEFPFTFSSV